jgi:hypothetical protein
MGRSGLLTNCEWFFGGISRDLLAWVGLLLVTASIVAYAPTTPFPGAIPPFLGTVLLLQSGKGRLTRVGALFSYPFVRWLGLASYSIYLWHWPVLALAEYARAGQECGVALRLSLACLGIFLGSISYACVERPCRVSSIWKRRPFLLAAVVLATCCYLGLITHYSEGFTERFPARVLRLAASEGDAGFLHELSPEDAQAGKFNPSLTFRT